MMQTKIESIQSKLLSMQDTPYRDFNAKLIPTVDPKRMIGIRTPLLRKFAKDLFKMEPKQAAAFMQSLPHRYFEENNLHAFLIRLSTTGQPAILLRRRSLKNIPMRYIKKFWYGYGRLEPIPSVMPSISCCPIILMTVLNRKCLNSFPR